jgi:opacity protein-like surface antigen
MSFALMRMVVSSVLKKIKCLELNAAMRVIFAILLCLPLCATHTFAQAIPAGRSKSWDLSLGYTYVSHPATSSDRVSLNGFDASVTVELASRLAIRGDVGYALSGNLLGAPAHSDVLSYLAGPVYYPVVRPKIDIYAQALFGGARVTGPVPVTGGILIGGYAERFAWAIGGGVDYQLSHSFALRGGVDYLRTEYFVGPSPTLQGQSNIRLTASIVCSLGSPPWKRRKRI